MKKLRLRVENQPKPFTPASPKAMTDLPKPSSAHCNFPWPVLGAGCQVEESEEQVLNGHSHEVGASQLLNGGCWGL